MISCFTGNIRRVKKFINLHKLKLLATFDFEPMFSKDKMQAIQMYIEKRMDAGYGGGLIEFYVNV